MGDYAAGMVNEDSPQPGDAANQHCSSAYLNQIERLIRL